MTRTVISTLRRWNRDSTAPPGRAGELFLDTLANVHASTSALFYWLLLVQYAAAIACALFWSPLAWSGSRSSVHFHVWLAVILGGLLTAFPVYLIRTNPAAALTRHVTAVSQMLMGSLLMHLTGGRIETHFHIFGSLAFLSFYCDTQVLVTATLTVILDHAILGALVPQSLYGLSVATNWRLVEHSLWTLFEDVFLVLACWKSRVRFSSLALQQAQLEEVNHRIEAAVDARTQELALTAQELSLSRAVVESTRLKTQFLATVSHELRTPMNGVMGMTNLLIASGLNEDQRECASAVLRSGEALLTIIDDILDCSKMEAGDLQLTNVVFHLPTEIEDAVELLAAAAQAKQLALICELSPGLPESVAGDAARLRQILVNLIGNAIKFTSQGEVIVCARLLERTENVGGIRFEVCDTGIGIKEEERRTLFKPFVQVDGSATRTFEGAGLGLAISKQIVQLMGGRIGLDSIPGRGSTFWFEIPLEVLTQSSSESSGMDSAVLRGLRVLIVDGSEANLLAIGRTLDSWGMNTWRASGSREAFDVLDLLIARHQPIQVVLVDAGPLGTEGLELARRIRERDSQYASPQIVILTPLGQSTGVLKTSLAAVQAAYLTKPVRRADLFQILAKRAGKESGAKVAGEVGAVVEPAPPTAIRPLNILVAEDNLVNQRVLSKILARLGHTCDLVGDGRAAVEAVKRTSYDVVLMDCQMPLLDGFGATVEIRAVPGIAGRVPIIAVTASAMASDRDRCLAAGMNDYMSKPVRFEQLAEALNAIEPLVAEPIAS